MKKIISVLLALAVIFSLASCDFGGNGGGGGLGGGDAKYSKIANALSASHPSYSISVSTTVSDDITLESRYAVHVGENGITRVDVTLQRLNDFSQENGAYEYKDTNPVKTSTGYILYEYGKLYRQGGARFGVEDTEIAFPSFNLSDECLTNVLEMDSFLQADISDMKAFSGWDMDCTNAKIEIFLSGEQLSSIIIEYEQNGGMATVVHYHSFFT